MDVKRLSTTTSSVSSNISRSSSGGTGNATSVAGNVPVTRVATSAQIANMVKRTVLSGDIIDVRNSYIKILLEDNSTLQARTQDASSMNIGDHINFQIKENNGTQVFIRSLNVSNRFSSPLIMALESAGIPVTEGNMQMIKEMMRNEMPIDKNAVLEMFKNINSYPQANPSTVVSLINHELPVSNENIVQFENYVNDESSILRELSNIAYEVSDFIGQSISSSESTIGDSGSNPSDMTTNINQMKDTILNLIGEFKDTKVENPFYKSFINVAIDDGFINTLDDSDITDQAKGVLFEENIDSEIALKEEAKSLIKSINASLAGEAMPIDTNENTLDVATRLINKLKEFSVINKEVISNFIKELPKDELEMFTKSKIFKDFFKDSLSKEFVLKPEELMKGEEAANKVKLLYNKIEEKTNRLIEYLSNNSNNSEKLQNNLSNLKNNLNFMNDMNQMASYVQLPLKLSNGEKNGELYVFNKSHGRMLDKDVLTAFMHLDMDYLGATDVNIRLENGSLSTKFSIADIESQVIIEEHLPELKIRLDNLGYNCTLGVELMEEKSSSKTPFEKVLEIDRPKMSIKRYSFDVRA